MSSQIPTSSSYYGQRQQQQSGYSSSGYGSQQHAAGGSSYYGTNPTHSSVAASGYGVNPSHSSATASGYGQERVDGSRIGNSAYGVSGVASPSSQHYSGGKYSSTFGNSKHHSRDFEGDGVEEEEDAGDEKKSKSTSPVDSMMLYH